MIVGCGHVGKRLARALGPSSVTALVRSEASASKLEAGGIRTMRCDLDRAVETALPTEGTELYYLVPPRPRDTEDIRLRHFLQALERSGQPRRLVYLGTTGVYGDCNGEWVDEAHPTRPVAERALRRADAERQLRHWQAEKGRELVLLRVAGIYGPGKLPLERLRAHKPMIPPQQAPWTNRIHVDDLVQALVAAMTRGHDGAIYNISDGHPGNMADYFNAVADAAGLPRPPLIDLEEAGGQLSKGLRSYLAESRRIDNRRMLEELGVILRYPTLEAGLASCFSRAMSS